MMENLTVPVLVPDYYRDDNSHVMTESDEKTLIELEKERRRIISNQAVRRKTIEKWMIDADSVSIDKSTDVKEAVYDFETKFMDNFHRFKKLEVIDTQRTNFVSALLPQHSCDTELSLRNAEKITSPPILVPFTLDTIDTTSIDTTSIIENKALIKEYWEKRMIAEQELISFDCIPNDQDADTQQIHTKIKSSNAQTNLNCNSKGDKSFGVTGKLGSDGESEASPESSLSPVDVDSLEGSEGRQSPEGEASSEQSENSHRDTNNSLSPCNENANIDNQLFESDFDRDICMAFERCERNELSTVLEEEHEPDSLEEFIKHESECMREETALIAKESKNQGDKEVLYEEIRDNYNNSGMKSHASITIHTTELTKASVGNLIVVDECVCEHKMGSILSQSIEKECVTRDHTDDNCQCETTDGQIINTDAELNNNESNHKYDSIVSEDITVQPKPQIIGETYHNDSSHESPLTAEVKISAQIKTPKNKRNSNPAELKIASEIRELKEREEELKKMRQNLSIKQFNDNNDNLLENQLSNHIENHYERTNGTHEFPVKSHSRNDNRIGSSESIMSALLEDNVIKHNQNTAPIRLQTQSPLENEEHIDVVKPQTDDYDDCQKLIKQSTESPIEREIRMSKEREEELRREKRLSSSSHSGTIKMESDTTPIIEKSETPVNRSKFPLFKQNSIGIVNAADTQKLLATTRIQQEIEDQTQREMALREIGSIQTLSQERTDAKVSTFRDMQRHTVNHRSVTCPEHSISGETSLELADGNYANHKFASSASSTSSSANFPAFSRNISSPTVGASSKGISMHKFINSKGRAAKDVFSPFTSSNSSISNGYGVSSVNDYHELKPPQFTKSNLNSLRRHVSAECKIKEELRAMEAREEELRRQRIRLLGLSQPNLNSMPDDGVDGKGTAEDNAARTNSNPNLIDDRNGSEENHSIDPESLQIGGPRRRIALIAQWEQKIKKDIKI